MGCTAEYRKHTITCRPRCHSFKVICRIQRNIITPMEVKLDERKWIESARDSKWELFENVSTNNEIFEAFYSKVILIFFFRMAGEYCLYFLPGVLVSIFVLSSVYFSSQIFLMKWWTAAAKIHNVLVFFLLFQNTGSFRQIVLLFQAYNTLFLLMRYLLCQNKVIPNFIICVICCGVCALLHYGLLFQAEMGIVWVILRRIS